MSDKLTKFKRRYYNLVRRSTDLRIEISKDLFKNLCERYLDNPYCEYCNCELDNGIKENNSSIDHIIPISSGGTNNPENLAICCGACNLIKGTISVETFSGILNVLQAGGRLDLIESWRREGYKGGLARKIDSIVEEKAND